jgi:cellulose synthase/poly-beta-1,6-N-acetylglucosamine synthase-like glycosyltransferase
MIINFSLWLAWLLTDLVATYGVWHYRRRLVPLAPAPDTPHVAILVAIKGVSASTPRFLEMLGQQRYPAYRLVFAVESRSDPALPLVEITQHQRAGTVAIDIVIAGHATQRAQKVHNLLAALATLRDEDRIVVYADADTLPEPEWLSQLIRPIANREVDASTGYRWQLPSDQRWPSLIVAAADMSIATSARSARYNLCWGGATAVDRGALDQLDLPSVWNRAASDDLTLSQALRSRGFKINAPLHVLVPSPVTHTWTSLFSFARRQYLMVRTYAPRHWVFAGWTLCVPALAASLAVEQVIDGRWLGASIILASLAMLQVRIRIRYQIAGLVLPKEAIATAKATIAFARWAWPLIHLVHLLAFLTSCVGQRFTWAGIAYRLDGKTVLVERRGNGA